MSGMRLNYTEIDGLTICYGEKGKRRKDKPSMILIHGFTACKFMWAPLVKVCNVKLLRKDAVCMEVTYSFFANDTEGFLSCFLSVCHKLRNMYSK